MATRKLLSSWSFTRSFHESAISRNSFINLSQFPEKFLEVYQEDKFVIVNKSPGLDCQDMPKGTRVGKRTPKSERDGLFSTLKTLDPEMRNIHRLDKWVSGGIIVARDRTTSQRFSRQLQKGGQHGYGFKRRYVGIIGNNNLPEPSQELKYLDDEKTSGIIHTKNEKGDSITKFIIPSSTSDSLYRIIILQLETGRKHQIRQHMSEVLKSPIFGDMRYGFEGGLVKDRTIGLHSAFIQTRVGMSVREFQIPVKYNKLGIWNDFIDQKGNFSKEIQDKLKNFETIIDPNYEEPIIEDSLDLQLVH